MCTSHLYHDARLLHSYLSCCLHPTLCLLSLIQGPASNTLCAACNCASSPALLCISSANRPSPPLREKLGVSLWPSSPFGNLSLAPLPTVLPFVHCPTPMRWKASVSKRDYISGYQSFHHKVLDCGLTMNKAVTPPPSPVQYFWCALPGL